MGISTSSSLYLQMASQPSPSPADLASLKCPIGLFLPCLSNGPWGWERKFKKKIVGSTCTSPSSGQNVQNQYQRHISFIETWHFCGFLSPKVSPRDARDKAAVTTPAFSCASTSRPLAFQRSSNGGVNPGVVCITPTQTMHYLSGLLRLLLKEIESFQHSCIFCRAHV